MLDLMLSAASTQSGRLPLVVEPRRSYSLTQLARDHGSDLRKLILQHKALLLRGFSASQQDFGGFVDAIASDRLSYIYRSTPRKTVTERIYTASAYPPKEFIPFHCENSYQNDWPMMLAFLCVEPAASGGATPLADVARVTARLPGALLDEFESRRVRYTRFYRLEADLPWHEVFQTSDREEVGRYCQEHGLAYAWHEGNTLSTSQVCQGTACHPLLGKRLWFNQANLFHSSSLGPEIEGALAEMYGRGKFPRNASFGDGGEIDPRSLRLVREAFDAEAVRFDWKRDDVLLIDNMQVAHSRTPYSGRRTVLVAMSDSYQALQQRTRAGC